MNLCLLCAEHSQLHHPPPQYPQPDELHCVLQTAGPPVPAPHIQPQQRHEHRRHPAQRVHRGRERLQRQGEREDHEEDQEEDVCLEVRVGVKAHDPVRGEPADVGQGVSGLVQHHKQQPHGASGDKAAQGSVLGDEVRHRRQRLACPVVGDPRRGEYEEGIQGEQEDLGPGQEHAIMEWTLIVVKWFKFLHLVFVSRVLRT
jgi:hypothetical protein